MIQNYSMGGGLFNTPQAEVLWMWVNNSCIAGISVKFTIAYGKKRTHFAPAFLIFVYLLRCSFCCAGLPPVIAYPAFYLKASIMPAPLPSTPSDILSG